MEKKWFRVCVAYREEHSSPDEITNTAWFNIHTNNEEKAADDVIHMIVKNNEYPHSLIPGGIMLDASVQSVINVSQLNTN